VKTGVQNEGEYSEGMGPCAPTTSLRSADIFGCRSIAADVQEGG